MACMAATNTARRMWGLFEPVHAVTYFAPACTEEFKAAGLKGFWMGYFAGRAAPMGAVGPAVVEATFYGFNPAMVRRALPDAWSFASVERVLEARLAGVDRVLRSVLAPVPAGDVERAAALARRACEDLDVGGRPLAAANSALPWPDEPHLVLWHAATILREHRGDGHVVALGAARLNGRQALVSAASMGAVPRALLQAARGWDDDAWDESTETLRRRGWLSEDGGPTDAGLAGRRTVEHRTDQLAAGPWRRLGRKKTEELATLLGPIVKHVAASGAFPTPNPIGLRPPD